MTHAGPRGQRLLVAVHDVTPRHFERLVQIDRFLQERGLGERYAMLVVPDFWGEWPLEAHPDFVAWLRERAAAGVEMILHGSLHRDTAEHRTPLRRFQATVMTNREGEFLGLDYAEARRRLEAGRALLESRLATPIHGFIAPAWLYGPGARRALRDLRFRFAEDQLRVFAPDSGRTLLVSPVVSYASRDARRVRSSIAWSRTATELLRPLPTARFAIHPHDLDVPALVAEIGRALDALRVRRTPARYAEVAGVR